MQALFKLKIALGPDDMKKLFQLGPTSPVTQQDLTGFVDSTCIVVEGTEITRKELVKYVANKLGGMHIDFARNPNKPLEAKFAKLDKIRESMSTAGKNSIYYELLSTGISLVKSADIQKLREKLDKILSS